MNSEYYERVDALLNELPTRTEEELLMVDEIVARGEREGYAVTLPDFRDAQVNDVVWHRGLIPYRIVKIKHGDSYPFVLSNGWTMDILGRTPVYAPSVQNLFPMLPEYFWSRIDVPKECYRRPSDI